MKVHLSKHQLVQAIGRLQSIVPSKPTVPVLANLSLEAVDQQLILCATDLTVSMRVIVEAKVLESGGITLPARRFFQLIRELTAPDVEIYSPSGETALINAGSSHFKIQGMAKSEFPPIPDLSGADEFTMPCENLKEMLARSSFAAARDDSRQVLNGILFQTTEGKGIFIGTDGKRLARLFTPLSHSGEIQSVILPLKAVEEIVKILDEKELPVKFLLTSDKAALEIGSNTLITKLLSGQYPDVTRVIPQKSENEISLHREELIALLRQVSLFTPDHSSSVRFVFEDNELELSANSGEIGEGKVSMPVKYAGPRLEVAFNPYYFLDILRHSKDEAVSLSLADPYNPGLISDSTDAQFVLMPMRLEN